MKFFADKLVFHRKQSHLTGEKIAKAMGVSRTTYWKWEKEHSEPNRKQVLMLAKILEIDVSEISDIESFAKSFGHGELDLSNNIESWLSFMNVEENKNFRTILKKSFKDTLKLSDKLNEAGIIIRALLTGLDSIFYIKDIDLKYITASSSFLKNLSLEENFKVYGAEDNVFFSKKEAKENNAKDEKVLIIKEKIIEEGYIPGTRNKKWGIISRMPIFDPYNNVKGVITNIVDITNRKRAELRHELLKLCIENIKAGVSISEYNSERIAFVNKAFSEITGFPSELVYDKGKNFIVKHCFIPDNKEQTEKFHKFWNSRPDVNEFKFKCYDESEKWIEDRHSSLVSFMNKEYIISIFNDITERKEQEMNSALLNIYLEETPIGIIIIDNKTNCPLYFNKAILNIYEINFPLEKLYKIDRFYALKHVYHPDFKDAEHRYIVNKNWPDRREIKIITPNKKEKWIEIIHLNKNVWGKNCNISVVSDITERKKNNDVIEILKRNGVDPKVIDEISAIY